MFVAMVTGRAGRLRHDLGLLLDEFRVEHVMYDALALDIRESSSLDSTEIVRPKSAAPSRARP